MRNVVSKFLGKNEKELNNKLIELANYYGFTINVTNAFSGNEKGSVENSVKTIRTTLFSEQYEFDSMEQLYDYAYKRLIEFNTDSAINEEKQFLLKDKVPYELCKIREAKVNKCSFIQVDNNKYSVPDYLVGEKLTVKVYRTKLLIYANNEYVCSHKRLSGKQNYSVDIFHYLHTLEKKPNALKDSIALEQNPELAKVFHTYYYDNPKAFIKLLSENRGKSSKYLIDKLSISNIANRKIRTQSLSQIAILTMQLTSKHNDLLMEVI